MVLRAYCDLSRSERVSVLAGYVGNDDQWGWLEAEWKKNLGYWELADFHLAELPGQMGHERADDCIRSFAYIVGKSGVEGISAGVENSFYDAQHWGSEFPSPYHVCADMLFNSLHTHVPLNLGGGPVTIVFDRDTNEEAAVHALLARYEGDEIFAGLAFSDRRRTCALQTADLAAGVVRKGWVEDNFFDLLPKANRLISNVLGKRHFGVALSFETKRVVDEARAKVAASEKGRGQ